VARSITDIARAQVPGISRLGRSLGRRWTNRPTVSLTCITGSSPGQARAFLQAWRPLVDEVVLAAQEDSDPGILSECTDLADRTCLLPLSHPRIVMERYLGWLHEMCRADWIIRADDDELPSEALRDALPRLVAERELTHFWLPRRWVYPDSSQYIADGLWLRDIQVRLVRNIPGIWRLAGHAHSNLVVEGASRISDAPLLHLDSLIKPRSSRREKMELYRELLGEVSSDGYRLNAVYEPEAVPDLPTAKLPPADRLTIDRFTTGLTARRAKPPGLNREPHRVSEDRINRWVGARQMLDGAYMATIRVVHPVVPIPADAVRHIQVEVRNDGSDWWPRGPVPEPAVFVGHRWRCADGTEVTQTPRTAFTELVGPGATTRLTVAIKAPPRPGRAELELDLVHEFVRWFGCPIKLAVDVVEREHEQEPTSDSAAAQAEGAAPDPSIG
jgi:hypothetical protein